MKTLTHIKTVVTKWWQSIDLTHSSTVKAIIAAALILQVFQTMLIFRISSKDLVTVININGSITSDHADLQN